MSSMRSASSSTKHLDAAQIDDGPGPSGRAAGPAWRRGCRRRGAAPRPAGSGRRRRRSTVLRRSQVLAVGAEALADLRGQLARRAEDQARARGGVPVRRGWSARRCRIGSANAAVLPVPVWRSPARRGLRARAGWPAPGWAWRWCTLPTRRRGGSARITGGLRTSRRSFGSTGCVPKGRRRTPKQDQLVRYNLLTRQRFRKYRGRRGHCEGSRQAVVPYSISDRRDLSMTASQNGKPLCFAPPDFGSNHRLATPILDAGC